MKKLVLLLFMFSATLCYSQTFERPPFTLKLFVNDTAYYEAPMGKSFFLPKADIIQVFPGEEIFVEADLVNDSLVNFKVVPEKVNTQKTIAISFKQEAENKTHKQMILSVTNPFAKSLVYKAQINLYPQKKWVSTSIMPVYPGLVGYEMWPDVITTIALYDLHLKSNQ